MVSKKKNYHHGDLRDQILEAVRELVEARGADGFSIAEVCRLAGVSTAAPYKHFTDRHEILRCVVLLAMERLRDAMQQAADSHPAGSPSRIAALGQSYINFARAEPGIFRIMFGQTEGHGHDPELARAGAETCGLLEGVVSEHLGLLPDHPEVKLRSHALWCFVHGHSFLCLDSKLPRDGWQPDEKVLLRVVGDAMLPPA